VRSAAEGIPAKPCEGWSKDTPNYMGPPAWYVTTGFAYTWLGNA
jgi:hypothetical protein